MVRKEACDLLGKLGGENSKDTLLEVLVQDDEPMVKAEAAYALGKIGYNENDEVARALAFAVVDQDVVNPDSNFAFAVLLAFENAQNRTPRRFLMCAGDRRRWWPPSVQRRSSLRIRRSPAVVRRYHSW